MPTRPRRNDVTGELLPPLRDGELVPYDRDPGDRNVPVVRMKLPPPRTDLAGPVMEHEARRPARTPGVASDFLVPVLQALGTTLAGAVLAATAAWLWHWPPRTILILTGLTFAAAWLWRLRLADGLLWEIERIVGYDVNGDHQVGAPAGAVLCNPAVARSEVARDLADQAAYVERDELVAFLARCYASGCSEAAHGITRGSGAERAAYIRRRDVLIALGIAQWKNENAPSAGWKLAVSHQRAAQLLERHVL